MDMEFKEGDQVDLIIGRFTDIGIRVIINEDFDGMLYRNEVFKKVREGQRLTGYVKKHREDGLIDVSLQPIGFVSAIEEHKAKILNRLQDEDGFLAINDKSTPELIKYEMQMSKKAFKAAVGGLFKEKKILIEPGGIKLVE